MKTKLLRFPSLSAVSLIMLALTARGESPGSLARSRDALPMPTSSLLVLSNVTGEVRVLDARGLVLESNLVYLPRIQLADLSPADLQSLLETKTAYDGLTTFGSGQGTNVHGAVMELQLQ